MYSILNEMPAVQGRQLDNTQIRYINKVISEREVP